MMSKNKTLPRALRGACSAIRALMTAGSNNEAANKYRIGCKVLELQTNEKKYGKNSVGQVAEKLGCTAALLYSYSTVAKTWTDSAFRSLLKKRNKNGLPLSFSHLIELAKAKSDERRRKVTTLALANGWSVRAVAAKFPQKKAASKTASRKPATIAEDIASSTASAVESFREHLTASLRINKEALEDADIRESLMTARTELRKAMTLSEKLDTKLTNLLGSAIQRKAA